MIVTHLKLKNWRNFRDVDVPLQERTYLLGANASGKSNFLEVFRFLRDICKQQGGGLQKAVSDRDGMQKLRCLHARRDPEVRIEVKLVDEGSAGGGWTYVLGFKHDKKRGVFISAEQVFKDGNDQPLLDRPDEADKADSERLTQTALEQIQANQGFREIATFFSATTYLHLVPQLLKHAEKIGGQRLEDDPFGQGFLERVARTPPGTRDARLRKIERALKLAVPQFEALRYEPDKVNGRPHLEARYQHHRPGAGWQREEHFSDGTLRLLGFLWVLLDGNSLLLLEEPELSLNDAIVRQIPLMLHRVLKDQKRKRQVLISTHSEALLSNKGIDGRGVLLLQPTSEGTKVRLINEQEKVAINSGFSIAEVVLPKTSPKAADQLGLWD